MNKTEKQQWLSSSVRENRPPVYKIDLWSPDIDEAMIIVRGDTRGATEELAERVQAALRAFAEESTGKRVDVCPMCGTKTHCSPV